MSEASEVPMVCVDCGGTMTDDDAIWSPGIGVLTHINYSQCIASLNERLTAATQRADAAEAERDALRKAVDAVRATRTEPQTRTGDNDDWVDGFQYGYAAALETVNDALDAALAVQPTTTTGPNT